MAQLDVHVISDEALGNASYLLEAGDGCAVSVDPRRDVGEHLQLAARLGLRIVAVLETHLHADFVSGSREIAAATAAEVVAAGAAGMRFDHRAISAGERLQYGQVFLDAVATPGHTPEHLAYLASDGERRMVFSGGSLIVGGAARTDLSGPERTDDLTRAQFASLRRLSSLPDDTLLHPTHGGGSFCSTGQARSAVSTIGDERATNALLAVDDEEEFVQALRKGFGSYPRYFAHLRGLNRAGARPLASLPKAGELSAHDAQRALAGGAWLVDARPIGEWAHAHAAGATSIELRPAFASWLGWVVPFGEPIVLMLEPGRVGEALRLARRIGYDAVKGWIQFATWQEAGLPVLSVPELGPAEAAARSASGAVLLDVRQFAEFDARHIASARHLELGDIIAGKTPDAGQVVTYCGHGERSATAASLLERRGIVVANLRGGIGDWRAEGLPLEP